MSENVTTDVAISPLVKRLPIDNAELWAKEMLNANGRQDVSEHIIKAGFDVRESARKMSELYTKLHKEAK